MGYEPRDNSGTLFENDKKQDSGKQPDYKGDAMINGQMVWISAWWKKGRNGDFLSLAFNVKEERSGDRRSSSNRPNNDRQSSHRPSNDRDRRSSDHRPSRSARDEEDEDIPF